MNKKKMSRNRKVLKNVHIVLLYVIWGILVTFVSIYFLVLQNEAKQTFNQYGWMNHKIDPISEQFLKYSEQTPHPILLEIGAGSGNVSLEALKNGAFTWVNELDARNLQDFSKNVPPQFSQNYKIVIGDFPSGLKLPSHYFDAILAVRVLHFFDPQKLREAISKMYVLLKPNGKVFIYASTPYDKSFPSFLAVYEQRKKRGDLFPGYTENIYQYNPEVEAYAPKKLHLLDPTVLQREFKKAGFIVTFCDFIGETTGDRSIVGLIAHKP